MKEIILHGTTKQELIQELKSELLTGFRAILQDHQKEALAAKEWLTTNEVSDLLKVSTVTIHEWSKKGRLKKHRIGRSVRYRADEVMSALRRVETPNL